MKKNTVVPPSGKSESINEEQAVLEKTSKQSFPTAEKERISAIGRRKRKKIDEYNENNDIKYRGPLSYRHLRAAAWGCLILARIGIIFNIIGKIDSNLGNDLFVAREILSYFYGLMMPLFLIAAFAVILNGTLNFKNLLLFYGGLSVLFYVAFVFIHERYLVGTFQNLFNLSYNQATEGIDDLIRLFVRSDTLTFNIFMDLFMCTALAFFMIYKPKKLFRGKRIIIFRLLSILPILFEIGSFTLKFLSSLKLISLSAYVYPLLTTKPPMTFIVFITLTLFIKFRERIYVSRGKTHSDYHEFLNTNANSWQFSKFAAITFFVAGLIDLIVSLILNSFASNPGDLEAAYEAIEQSPTVIDALLSSGVGDSSMLIIVSPIVLLFSYTRKHKNPMIDVIIVGVALSLLILTYMEAIYNMVFYFSEKFYVSPVT